MATSWGIDPLKDVNGQITIGTTADDFRQIQGGLYSPGLISGGVVTRSASAMTYTVSAGVAAFPIVTSGAPQTVLGPIPAATLTTTAASSGTRLDIIYAQQRLVSVEGDPNIVVAIGTSLPARAVLLNAFIVTTTTTNTLSATQSANIAYSIPYGASLGLLADKRSTFAGNFTVSANDITGSFYLPTDRLIRISVMATFSAYQAIKFDNTKYCEAGYDVYIDELKRFAWTTEGLHQAWSENHWSDTFTLQAGTHTYRTVRYRAQSPGTPVARGCHFTIEDIGPVV